MMRSHQDQADMYPNGDYLRRQLPLTLRLFVAALLAAMLALGASYTLRSLNL